MDMEAVFPRLVGPPGELVPEVDPARLKEAWGTCAWDRATGQGAWKELGTPPVDARALTYRCMMLKLLDSIPDNAPEEVLRLVAPLKQNGHLIEAALNVGARFPMTWLPGVGSHPMPYDLEAFVEEVRKERGV